MCGIFGVSIKEVNNDLFDNLLYIYTKQKQRGHIGFGVALNRRGELSRIRGSGDSDQLFTNQNFINFWKNLQNGDKIIAHHRFATTGGDGYCKEANHPIANENENIMIVHNGGLYHYKNIYKNLIDKNHEFETEIKTITHNNEIIKCDITDSEVLVHLLERGIMNIKNITGSLAIAYFRKHSDKIYFYRTTNPIIVYKDKSENIYFSSELHNDSRFILVSELTENVQYTLTDKLKWIKRVKELEQRKEISIPKVVMSKNKDLNHYIHRDSYNWKGWDDFDDWIESKK